MSLDFCCDIQMVGSKLRKEHESMDPALAVGGVMVWGIFSWHTLGPLVPIEPHRLNGTAYLSIVADHVHVFMSTVYPFLMATSSRIMHHATKLKSPQTGFLNMTMSSLYSNGLHSHQISIRKSTFGMWWNGRVHHGCAADKSAETVWCYHVNMDQNLWGMFPTPCRIYATNN